ncbi:MAG TPA: AAA family ATPase, partial [Kamptonema sp.]|nr:AAA family ATPase [Kamptonema sp.]
MLKTIKIENFRGFQSFELQQLGRINLLVGQNNSGKTSALEAIQLLCSRKNTEQLSEVMINRGEIVWDQNNRSGLDVRHLFYGHQIEPKIEFSISGINDDILEKVVVSIKEVKHSIPTWIPDEIPEDQREKIIIEILNRPIRDTNELLNLAFIIKASSETGSESLTIPLSPNGCLPISHSGLSWRTENQNKGSKSQFITSSSLKISEMIEMFDRVVLTPEEENVYEALQTIDPVIKRIATVSSDKFQYAERSRGGFDVLRSDTNQRVPIGSMGDGIWRMFGLALSTVCAKDGFLFVDEIDTGL